MSCSTEVVAICWVAPVWSPIATAAPNRAPESGNTGPSEPLDAIARSTSLGRAMATAVDSNRNIASHAFGGWSDLGIDSLAESAGLVGVGMPPPLIGMVRSPSEPRLYLTK